MKKTLFNENWTFRKDGTEIEKIVCLPHDAMIYEKRSADAKSSDAGAFFNIGTYTYEKKIDTDAKHAFLNFDGVYKDAKVFLNDELKKEYAYGYSPFVAELGTVKKGDVVKVTCGIADGPDSRWYPGAGIYRDVDLYTSDEDEFVPVYGVKVSTLDYKSGKINVKVNAENAKVEIFDAGKVVASAEGNDVDFELENVRLWSEDDPYLYTVNVTVGNDSVEERFGVRQVEYNSNGFFVNGRNTLLKGGCVHHDNGLLGSATYCKSEYRRVKALKDAGFNAIRSAHNPTSKYLLDACDELGMYVMDETWDMWFHKKSVCDYGGKLWRQHYKEDIENMVARDFNHPSVILYSIGNEVSEPAKPEGVEATKEMVKLIHELDPNRFVTGGFNLMIIFQQSKGKGIYKEEGGREGNDDQKTNGMSSTMFNLITSFVGSGMNKAANSSKVDKLVSPSVDALDMAGYNYASGRYPLDAKLHPTRVIFGSETMPYTIDENWEMVKKIPTLVGDFMWTAWDYIGENGIGAWSYEKSGAGFSKPYPWWLADTGAFDIIGTPNAEAFWSSAAWDALERPMITLQPINHERRPFKASWRGTNGIPSYAWKGCDGKKAVVEVFFHCDHVELYQNSKKVASGKPKGSRTTFKIKYVPGTLEAVAFDAAGNEIARNVLSSAKDAGLKLSPEEKEVKVNDIVYVDFEIADENGVLECNADRKVNVSVENGELLAFGSANPCTLEDIHSGEYTTYYGKALAIVKATKAGEIRVTAKAGSEECEATVKVTK
ncbi:MAG: DUF4982 domain-containing protein [Erysipelotrichaceae bacterium]|nr:DUF4982 domain-containing protein [Erysipelotrichaceae bacterium]